MGRLKEKCIAQIIRINHNDDADIDYLYDEWLIEQQKQKKHKFKHRKITVSKPQLSIP